MKIDQLENGSWIRISKNSITVLNEGTGKTRGVIRDVTPFMYLQPNRQCDFFKDLRKSGIWGKSKAVEHTVYVVGERRIYFLYDMRRETEIAETAKEYFPCIPVRY